MDPICSMTKVRDLLFFVASRSVLDKTNLLKWSASPQSASPIFDSSYIYKNFITSWTDLKLSYSFLCIYGCPWCSSFAYLAVLCLLPSASTWAVLILSDLVYKIDSYGFQMVVNLSRTHTPSASPSSLSLSLYLVFMLFMTIVTLITRKQLPTATESKPTESNISLTPYDRL